MNNNKSSSRNTAPSDTTKHSRLSASELKHCNSCHQQLPLSEFHMSSTYNDGLMYICKSCNKKAAKRHYYADLSNNREKAAVRMRTLRQQRKQALAA